MSGWTSLARGALVIALLTAPALTAHATITFYGSQADFDAAFASAQHIDFASLTPTMGDYTAFPGAKVTVGPDTFRANEGLYALNGCGGGCGTYGQTFLSGQSADMRPVTFVIQTPHLSAIGFDYGSYIFSPLPITVKLSTGEQFSIADATEVAQFIGFSSSLGPIGSVTLSGWAGDGHLPGTVIDVIDVSQALAPLSPTPEPAEWALILLGFGAVGAVMRRRRAVFS